MIDREKVINGLECCAVGAECDHCPYSTHNKDGYEGCYQMHVDALALVLALLKAQEPRVMTLEEVADWHKKQALEREPIYVEYRPNSCLGISQWTIDYFGFNPNYYPNKEFGLYGRWIRCWTSRPTDEQREAEKWRDSAT